MPIVNFKEVDKNGPKQSKQVPCEYCGKFLTYSNLARNIKEYYKVVTKSTTPFTLPSVKGEVSDISFEQNNEVICTKYIYKIKAFIEILA